VYFTSCGVDTNAIFVGYGFLRCMLRPGSAHAQATWAPAEREHFAFVTRGPSGVLLTVSGQPKRQRAARVPQRRQTRSR
jgi:hypothetical protein